MVLLLASIILEVGLYTVPFFWARRKYLVAVPLILTAFSTGMWLFERHDVLSLGIAFVGAFRVFNHLRVAEGRMHERYLLRATRRTGLILGTAQGLVVGASMPDLPDMAVLLRVLAIAQAAVACAILIMTVRNLIKTKHQPQLEHYADRDLPTLTVAIPARNETADLEECLHTVLASDYPKLEILVLDDCSQDKTSEIIKSFAHDGVRFIKGREPEGRWLAKNHAYDRLADEANGEFIVFCGVDVRFGQQTLRALMTTALNRKKDMVSVMPRRLSGHISSSFIQSMRYWWELVPPRRLFSRPPVLSTCWLIRRKKLKELGSMEAVRHAIIPEGYFARELVRSDAYSFVRADDVLDVQTRKKTRDQYDTAIRTRYPQIRRRPEMALLLTVIQFAFLLGPFALLVAGLWADLGVTSLLAAGACVGLVLTHVMIVRVSDPANTLLALIDFPLACLAEVALGYMSMFKYEFSEVDWKGRNICIPVMHVYPTLPPQL